MTLKVKSKRKNGFTDYELYTNNRKIGSARVHFREKGKQVKQEVTFKKDGKWVDRTYAYPLFSKTAEMPDISIDKKYRGKGYGRKFLKEIEGDARKRGMKTFAAAETKNISFFEHMGYQHRFYSAGSGIYQKRLKKK